MNHDTRKVLIVDDDADISHFLSTCFDGAGYSTRCAANGDEALWLAAEFAPDVVFLDILIPEEDGWLVCSKLKLQPGGPLIVLITGQKDRATKRFADFVHADAFLEKPFGPEQALDMLREPVPQS
jgi:two-component system OmpR family response regulator